VIPQTIHTNIYKFSHNFLEQYYILSSKDFNLNTQLVVNFRANQGKILYIYSKNKNILLYQSPSKAVFIIETEQCGLFT